MESFVFRMNPLPNKFQGRFNASVVLKDTKIFFRPNNFSGGDIPSKTTGMAQSLGFRQVGLPSPQLPSQVFLLSDIDESANKPRRFSVFEYRDTDTPNSSKLPVWSNHAVFNIVTDSLSDHPVYVSLDYCAISRMHNSDVISNRRNSFCRIESKNPVEMRRPVIADSVRGKRPGPRIAKALALT